MNAIRDLSALLLIGLLLSGCAGIAITPAQEIDTPEAISTPLADPTGVPASSGFPYAAILSGDLPLEGLILAAHAYADQVCYDLGIYQDGHYVVLSCLPDFTYPTSTGQVDAYKLSYINRWVERFQSFEKPSAQGLIRFTGMGSAAAGYSDIASMRALIGDIEWDAHGYIHRGGWPPAVLLARSVLSTQLGIPLDNNSVLKFEVVDFPDTCLGAPRADEACASVITQGFRIELLAQGMLYEFHTDLFGYEIREFGEPQIAPTPGAAG